MKRNISNTARSARRATAAFRIISGWSCRVCFPDLMPGPGGYKSFGMVWEEGHEIPVGFSKKVVGFARITNNCAVCHTATYRLSERRSAARRCRGAGP